MRPGGLRIRAAIVAWKTQSYAATTTPKERSGDFERQSKRRKKLWQSRLNDLLQKWSKECKTMEDIRYMMVQGQLVDALPWRESPRRLKMRRNWQTTICGHGNMSIAQQFGGGGHQDSRSSWNKGTRDARDTQSAKWTGDARRTST